MRVEGDERPTAVREPPGPPTTVHVSLFFIHEELGRTLIGLVRGFTSDSGMVVRFGAAAARSSGSERGSSRVRRGRLLVLAS